MEVIFHSDNSNRWTGSTGSETLVDAPINLMSLHKSALIRLAMIRASRSDLPMGF